MNKASRKKSEPEGWREVKLGEIAEISKTNWKVGDKPFPYIGLEHIEENTLRLNSIGDSSNLESNKYRFKSGDVLFGKLRPYFRKVVKSNFNGVCSTDIWVIRAKENIDARFIFYFFANRKLVNIAYSSCSGTRMPRADWSFLSQTVWNIPPLAEQKAIVEVLSSLDDKIDLLHRQNRTLEDIAQTLFRQWFIEGEKADWAVGTLSDEFDVTMGQSPLGTSYNEEKQGMPLFQGNADFSFRFPRNRVWTTEPKRCAEEFDTLISVRAPVGEQNMATEKCCIGRGVAAFRYKKNKNFRSYTYYKMKSLMRKIRQFNQEGTVFGSISKSDFEDIEIVLPPFRSIQGFQNITKLLDQKIVLNHSQIRELEKLREILLPKLINGAVRVQVLNN